MDRIARTPPAALASLRPAFQDPRLDELFFRYRARNWPETLSPAERERWARHCRDRLERPPAKGLLDRDGLPRRAGPVAGRQPDREPLWRELEAYEATGCPCS